jgi:hypothetical protein
MADSASTDAELQLIEELEQWRQRALSAETQIAELTPPVLPTLSPGAGFRLVVCEQCGATIANLDDNDGAPEPMRNDLERRLREAHVCA